MTYRYVPQVVVWIACEGSTDKAYLAALNRLLSEKGVHISLKAESAGSGLFKFLEAAYRKCMRKRDKSCKALPWIWADSDLYERNEKKCRDQYVRRAPDIPEILFSRHNLEDVLVMHEDDQTVQRWITLCKGGLTPLHSHEYMPLLADIYPDYSKRGLPKRLVPLTPQQLHNAYRHSLDESIPFKCDLIERLVPIIRQDSPDFFN